MLKIFKHLKLGEWLQIGVSIAFIVTQVWLDLKLPDYMAKITQLVQTEGSAMRDIWINGGYMLLCALGSVISAVIVGFFAARIGASFSQRMRSMLFNKVESFSMGEINRFSTASLITRSTNDVVHVQMLITMGLQIVVKAPIMAIWAVLKIYGKGLEWSLATGVAILILVLMFSFLLIMVFPKFKKMQALTDNLNRITRENLTGIPVVRAYNAEDYQQNKFETANEELTKTQLFTSRSMSVIMPVMTLIMSGLSLAIYWIGAILIHETLIPLDRVDLFSNMVVFTQYAMQVIMAFMMITMMFIMLPRASVSAKRIFEVLETQPTIIYGDKTEGLPGLKGDVVFQNVSFKYPDAEEYVLHNVSFSVKQGETIAFIGSTGSGKSTLVNLVNRFFDATEGEVLINGTDIKEYSADALHNKIGYVPQKAVLFSGTVTSNVAYGNDFEAPYKYKTYQRVAAAVSIAQGKDFVENMNDSYDSAVARGGTNLSGGQKQRLAIARAVCRNPEIYIFDDSFSALDYKTDRALRTALKKETTGVTSMIVAQRVGTIMDADKIVVLDNGEVVGTGTHKELLKICDVYKDIAASQLSEEELAL